MSATKYVVMHGIRLTAEQAAAIKAHVATAPPFTPEQRDTLRAILTNPRGRPRQQASDTATAEASHGGEPTN